MLTAPKKAPNGTYYVYCTPQTDRNGTGWRVGEVSPFEPEAADLRSVRDFDRIVIKTTERPKVGEVLPESAAHGAILIPQLVDDEFTPEQRRDVDRAYAEFMAEANREDGYNFKATEKARRECRAVMADFREMNFVREAA